MTSFLSHLHADLRRTRFTRRGATHSPKDAPRGTHKEYSRMERIALPMEKLTLSLSEALDARTSTMTAGTEVPLTTEEIGTVFGNALRRRSTSLRRNYPSGGALFPIETYLICAALEHHRPSVFHYHPTAHALERLWYLPEDFDMSVLVPRPEFLMPSALVVFTSVWNRSSKKYGDFTYELALLEAGHMSENVLLTSAALGLEVRPMAGFNDQRIIELLDIDEEYEQPVHSITISKSSAATTTNDIIDE